MQRTSAPRSGESLRWDDVRLFLALCRARTLGGAARSLGVDASTISRKLTVLERSLSASLFDRGRDGIHPTEAAAQLLPVAEELEEGMRRFGTAAEGLERTVAGLVRLSCPPDTAEVLVAPLLPELRRRHPDLRLEIDPSEAVVDLSRREADLALRTVRPARGDLIVTRLLTVRWILVAAPRLARELGTLRQWSDAPWIAWSEQRAGVAPARWLARHAGTAQPVVRTDSLSLQLTLVQAGLGVALVPAPSAEHRGLAPVKVGRSLAESAEAWPTDELFLVTHRALRNVPRVRVVWELLAERAARFR